MLCHNYPYDLLLGKISPIVADIITNQVITTSDTVQDKINNSMEVYLTEKLGDPIQQSSSYTPFKVASMLFFHVPYAVCNQSVSKFSPIQHLANNEYVPKRKTTYPLP